MLAALIALSTVVGLLWLFQFLVACILTDFDKQLKALQDRLDTEENDVR